MMFQFTRPTRDQIAAYVNARDGHAWTYDFSGLLPDQAPRGYKEDHRRVQIGQGEADYAAARAAIERWDCANLGWVFLAPDDRPPQEGHVVAVVARSLGLWWINACRVRTVIDVGPEDDMTDPAPMAEPDESSSEGTLASDPSRSSAEGETPANRRQADLNDSVVAEPPPLRRYGFAHGTLHDHIGRGEERFLVEMLPDGSVWYDLRAYSKPGKWFSRAGYWFMRGKQRQFGRDSCAKMRAVVEASRKAGSAAASSTRSGNARAALSA